ncbi:MAG: hypothetical protein V7711_13205 [Pseudomonadales bacterium]
MKLSHKTFRLGAIILACCLAGSLLSARFSFAAENTSHVDFTGYWSLDYLQSDDIEGKISTLLREERRRAERLAQSGSSSRRVDSGGAMVIGNGRGGPTVIDLAQMADMVASSQLLEIEQSPTNIKFKREDNFRLSCDFDVSSAVDKVNPLGTEVCGWSGHQMLFTILLPEGLTIRHRLTLGPRGTRLNVATTVISDRVYYPFTVNRVYNRYEPQGDGGISCEVTLSKGKVCTTESR